jgi:hypothetical protein
LLCWTGGLRGGSGRGGSFFEEQSSQSAEIVEDSAAAGQVELELLYFVEGDAQGVDAAGAIGIGGLAVDVGLHFGFRLRNCCGE